MVKRGGGRRRAKGRGGDDLKERKLEKGREKERKKK